MIVVQVLGSSAGGVARHVGQVSAALRARGDDVRVAGPTTVRDLAVPAGVAFASVEIADRPRLADAGAVRRLRALVRGADVVHAHGLRAGALAVMAARSVRGRPRVVVTLHNLPVGSSAVRLVSGVLERVVAWGADVVLGVSTDLVERMEGRGARAGERALVPAPSLASGAASTEDRASASVQVRHDLGIGSQDPLVVTVARLAPQKGLDVMVDVAGRSSLAAVTWVVAGDGPLREELEDRAIRRQAPVRFLGRRDDVGRLLLAADVVVSTAVWEGQPIGVQEALGAGAALVVTDAGGTREVTGEAAIVVPVGDADAVGDAVEHLVKDPDARARLRRAARERFEQLPGLSDVVAQLARVYGSGTSVTP